MLGAHPRSHGEKPPVYNFALMVAGSSPLTRGKHRRDMRRPYQLGLIPDLRGKL